MSESLVNLYIFSLSCIVGYHVIWGVTPTLHTPLMAVTNAISGVVIVGAILVTGSAFNVSSDAWINWVAIVGFFAALLASINIFGGFTVTHRILAMFRKKTKKNV